MATKTFVGKIVSDKIQKTVIVEIERKVEHPLYKKLIRKTKRFAVDLGTFGGLKIGDTVKIQETRPISKNKHFKVVEKR